VKHQGYATALELRSGTFSILERIDVGETNNKHAEKKHNYDLSVSSNGSTWVKQTVSC